MADIINLAAAQPITEGSKGIRVFADGRLVYDSRLEGYELTALQATSGLNIGGTATITMPYGHPAYNYFVGQRTVVTIYRDGKLRFRGRALYSAEDILGQRTITCEGELCFLRDAINRPYKYQSTPAKIFRALVRAYNEQVESWKQFSIGPATVEDPNDYVAMESESAETVLDTLNKLVERCGGHITFYDAEDGTRAISYLASIDNTSGQVIELGENLLDFASTGASTTTLATGLIPYGARDEETQKRITIESVNGGKDYIIAEDAQAIRGTIMATATWDDVATPENLLKKARAYLNEKKVFITSLTLTALDLSYLDQDIDSFAVGDMIQVRSKPHGIDEAFQLSQLTEDFLNPAANTITLGKEVLSLTGADVAGDYQGMSAIGAVKVNYTKEQEQLASSIMGQVAEGYASQAAVSGLQTQVGDVQNSTADLQTQITNEVNARAGVINKVDGTVHISGGAPIKMLGGRVDIQGSEVHLGDSSHPTSIYSSGNVQLYKCGATFDNGNADFSNNFGIRMKNTNGSIYYVLRVDATNNCFVGNDYTNLYLRGKDAVYLHKTGAAVTSDGREKNGIEALPEAYTTMLDKLTPVRFKYNGRGDRYHVGFIAQDVDAALTEAGLSREDFGGFVDLNGDGTALGLAYDEFIGLLLEKIRKLENRIEKMEGKAWEK